MKRFLILLGENGCDALRNAVQHGCPDGRADALVIFATKYTKRSTPQPNLQPFHVRNQRLHAAR